MIALNQCLTLSLLLIQKEEEILFRGGSDVTRASCAETLLTQLWRGELL